MEILLSLAIAMLAGLMLSRVTKLLNLPAVTAYLLSGIIVGPYCIGKLNISGIGFTSGEAVAALSIISDVALGFIAFSIGNEFRVAHLKNTGRQATVIGILQAVATTIFVDIILIVLHFAFPEILTLPVAITLGAIAAATAPATTLMVVRQYKAKGKLTDLLLPIVAIDDAVGLILFAVSLGIAKAIQSGHADIISIIVEPVLEIALSLLLGALVGCIFTLFEKLFHSNSKRLSLTICFVLFTIALAKIKFTLGGIDFGFSPLLTCMMLGTMFCNLCDYSADIMERSDKWTAPLFVLFFVISGAGLKFNFFSNSVCVIVGIAFIISRSIGKYIGSYGSARFVGCERTTCRWLGITMLPQEGVALGMCLSSRILGGSEAELISNVVLFAVLVYGITAPILTKFSLTKAGEIIPSGKRSSRIAKPKY